LLLLLAIKKVIVTKEKIRCSVADVHGNTSKSGDCGHYTTSGGIAQEVKSKKVVFLVCMEAVISGM